MASGRVRLARVIGPLSEDPERARRTAPSHSPPHRVRDFSEVRGGRVLLQAHRFCGVALRSPYYWPEVGNLNCPDFGNRLLQLLCYQNCVLSFCSSTVHPRPVSSSPCKTSPRAVTTSTHAVQPAMCRCGLFGLSAQRPGRTITSSARLVTPSRSWLPLKTTCARPPCIGRLPMRDLNPLQIAA